MKRLEISKLMDEYTDTEFFPTEGSAANLEGVRSRVLATASTEKRRTPSKKRLFLVMLAAAMVILMGAGIPRMMYQFATGSLNFGETLDSRHYEYRHDGPLMKLEEGRLYFVLDGQSIDITDQISEDTPYIYDGSDPETGMTHYVILGGTPESYGYLEWITVPSPFTPNEAFGDFDRNGMIGAYEYRWMTPAQDEPDEEFLSGGVHCDAVEWDVMMDRPWLLAGAKQLDIPFVDPGSGTDDIFYMS